MRLFFLLIVQLWTFAAFVPLANASPIGYSGQIIATASAGFPSQSDTRTYGLLSGVDPIPTLFDLLVVNDTGTGDTGANQFGGSAHATAQVIASGGSAGIYIKVLANEDLNAPEGFQRSTNASALVQTFFHDHWTVDAPDFPVGTMLPFVGKLFRTRETTTSEGGTTSCGRTAYDENGVISFVECQETHSLQVNTQVLTAAGPETNFEVFLPARTSVQMSLGFSVFVQAVSWNPLGPGNGPVTGLGFEYNGLHTAHLFIAPAGPGYSLVADSGNSFAFPASTDPDNPAAVPVPASMALLGTGLAGLSAHSWRRRRNERRGSLDDSSQLQKVVP